MKQMNKITDRATSNTTNLELLLFSLGTNLETGRNECYGLNVFKIKEILTAPPISATPGQPDYIEGITSLRGNLLPVLNLSKFLNIETSQEQKHLIVAEFNNKVQGFLVAEVETIHRIPWDSLNTPPEMISSQQHGFVSGVAEKQDENGVRLIMILDVERILHEVIGEEHTDDEYLRIQKLAKPRKIFFVDDSAIARKQIEKTLASLGAESECEINGKKALERLKKIADGLDAQGERVCDHIGMILTDIEMPEMDGFALTKAIKADQRFQGVPIVMHSSLTGATNEQTGRSAGADDYLVKFEPSIMAQKIHHYLQR